MRSADPAQAPILDPCYLADPADLKTLAAAVRVHGVPGLRVADASVMPAVTSGNTNAATIMIGERCADIILTATR